MPTYWEDFAEHYKEKHGLTVDDAVKVHGKPVVGILEEFFYFLKNAGFGECPD